MSDETQGSKFTESRNRGFTSIETVGNIKEDEQSYGKPSFFDIHIKHTISELETRFPFTATIIALVGYIVIASFDGMNTLGQFLGYVIFLAVVFIFYYISSHNFKEKVILYALSAIIALEAVALVYNYRNEIQDILKTDISIERSSPALSDIETPKSTEPIINSNN